MSSPTEPAPLRHPAILSVICQKCDASQKKKEVQDKRSNCCSEIPEKVTANSGRQMGKWISGCAEGREIEIIALELPWPSIGWHDQKLVCTNEDWELLANSVLVWGQSLRSLPDQANNFVLSCRWNLVLVGFNRGLLSTLISSISEGPSHSLREIGRVALDFHNEPDRKTGLF